MNEANTTGCVLTAMPRPVETDERSHSTRNGLICALVVAACVLISNPVASMPFIDDFSYTKTALEFARTGHFIYNGWATAMLGWLVPFAAIFIKVFGFSFTVVRLSMLPIDMATVFVFHQILRRFGINPQNAIVGTLTMSLSPLFLPMAASYMTDVPGILVILLCVYMCQRAIAARSDRKALLWLFFAMLVNVAGGTARQIAWLGALVMVPATAWLLRDRRGMKTAGIPLWVIGLLGVLACLHWFNEQPYSVPEHIFAGHVHIGMLGHLAVQLAKAFLCLILLIFPILAAWLPTAHRLNNKARLRFFSAIVLWIALEMVLFRKGLLGPSVMPWLTPILEGMHMSIPAMFGMSSNTLTLSIRLAVSFLVIASALIFLEQIASRKNTKLPYTVGHPASWNKIAWILGPFSLSYLMLLMPRGIFSIIQDRYLLGLVPFAVIVLLKLYQEAIAAKLPTISLVALIVFAAYAILGTHDLFAISRALVSSVQMVQTSGVPRRSIQTSLIGPGFTSDGWAQIQAGGHINDPRIQIPLGAYNPHTLDLKLHGECTSWFITYTPAIIPKYFVVSSSLPCLAPTRFPPVRYRAWLPPFHRELYVQRLRSSSN